MNIFVVNNDPWLAAEDLCDQHVVKMTLETAQMLSTACWTNDVPAPYKKTHYNHPCNVWVRASRDNYVWLIEHGLALSVQYRVRYGKIHKSEAVIKQLAGSTIMSILPNIGLTKFALAMPDQYKTDDPVQSYRKFYVSDKAKFATWNFCDPPSWWPR